MNEAFKPKYETKQFSIVIDVYDNGLTFDIKPAASSPKYYEVIGSLHQITFSVMEQQREEAKKEFVKHKNKLTK